MILAVVIPLVIAALMLTLRRRSRAAWPAAAALTAYSLMAARWAYNGEIDCGPDCDGTPVEVAIAVLAVVLPLAAVLEALTRSLLRRTRRPPVH